MNLRATIFLKTFLLAAALCFFSGSTFAQTQLTKSFTESSSWEVPAGVTSLTIECVGGGGAGGYVHGVSPYILFQQSGAGGGGAYAKRVVEVTGGETVSVTVGKGGHAWASDGNQVDGGASEVSINSVIKVKAAGGKTVKGTNTTTGAAGGSASDCIGDQKYSGGNGGNGEPAALGIQHAGGGGGAAGSTGPGNAGSTSNGGAATSQYGGAGGNARSVVGTGRTGGNYGGGGSGSKCTGIGGEYGGEGANGYVIITYVAPPAIDVDNMMDTVCSGESFTINPTGTIPVGTTYSWSAPSVAGISGTTGGSGASNISGTLTNSTYSNIDVVYSVTAKHGTDEDNFTVTITVRGIIDPGTIGDKIISCNVGDTLKSIISTTDASGNGQYSWESSTDGLTWTAVPNAINKEYTPPYAGHLGTTYYRRLFSSVCATVNSNIDTVNYPGNVSPGNVTTEDAKNNYCYGTNIDDTLKANPTVQNGSFTIQWQEYDGSNWTNIAGANDTLYKIVITNFTASKKFRYTIQLPGCAIVPSNNEWELNVVTIPVINQLTPSDRCPGLDFYIITPDITSSSTISTYTWTGTKDAHNDTIIPILPNCGTKYKFSLIVTDANGCSSAVKNDSLTTYTQPHENYFKNILNHSGPFEADFNLSTCKYEVPDLRDTLEKMFASIEDKGCNWIIDYSQTPAAGTVMDPNDTKYVSLYIETCNTIFHGFDQQVNSGNVGGPALTAADIEFDDSNDTINLYYGICDTLYYVNTPAYDVTSSCPYAKADLILTNDQSSANEGTILGRISGGEHTIVWRLTTPCGKYVEFPKKYIVMYPPCGGTMTVEDADHNVYQTVRVGCECWTKPNLKTITGVTGNSYVYQNKDANIEKFGRLYSWYSAVGLPENSTNAPDTITDPVSHVKYIQGICPEGWAVPTKASFESLYQAAGENVKNIKSTNISTWLTDMAGTDITGFSAVGAGYYMDESPYFFDLLGETFFWTSEGAPVEKKGTCCSITLTCPKLLFYTTDVHMGYSIRCVKRKND